MPLFLPLGFLGPSAAYVEPRLLDQVASAAVGAFGLRLLRDAYAGPALRVRRSSDNAETDIFFSNKLLDQPSLLAFCGAGDGYVPKFYDQSGQGNHAVQATAANQPRIVAAGVVDLQGGKPCIVQVFDRLYLPVGMFAGATGATAITAFRQASGAAGWGHVSGHPENTHTPYGDNNAYEGFMASLRPAFGPYGDAASAPVVHTALNSGGTLSVFRNGAQAGSAQGVPFTASPARVELLSDTGLTVMSEALLFAAALSTADRQAVERDMGTFYGITVA